MTHLLNNAKKGIALLLAIAVCGVCFTPSTNVQKADAYEGLPEDSSCQIVNEGGAYPSITTYDADGVQISKTVEATDMENYFDITLSGTIQEPLEQSNVDVVLVIDISNTMNYTQSDGNTRLENAKTAAKQFITSFCESSGTNKGARNIGCVMFNANAYMVWNGMQNVDPGWAEPLCNYIDGITAPSDNEVKWTNTEAGLMLAHDLLVSNPSDANNKKFVVFLTDGLPTTYIEDANSYSGYNPTMGTFTYDAARVNEDGYFSNSVRHELAALGIGGTNWTDGDNCACGYGANYSDKGALRAQNEADAMKADGIEIYTVGVNANRTLTEYALNTLDIHTANANEVVIGGFETLYSEWLKNSISSAPENYADANSEEELTSTYAAFLQSIEDKIKYDGTNFRLTTDTIGDEAEFVNFFKKDGSNGGDSITGTFTEDGENTVVYDDEARTIAWTISTSDETDAGSGFTMVIDEDAGLVYKTFSVKYRVRLCTEKAGFVAGQTYVLNESATMQVWSDTDNELKTITYPVPSVKGFLGTFNLKKISALSNTTEIPLPGAEFTLSHSTACAQCGNDITVADAVETTGADGKASFTNIASGHTYILSETNTPEGFYSCENSTIEVLYGNVFYNGQKLESSEYATISDAPESVKSFTDDNMTSGATVELDDVIEYSLVWSNHNDAKTDATITLTDVLDKGLEYVEGSASYPVTSVTANNDGTTTIKWTFGPVAYGAAGEITYECKITDECKVAGSNTAVLDNDYYLAYDNNSDIYINTLSVTVDFPEYTLTYHVAGDDTYGIPGGSVTPSKVTGIEYKGTVNPLANVPTTTWTTADGTANSATGTWTFIQDSWFTTDSYSTVVTGFTEITEDKDVYGKWEFTPDTYTLTYNVAGDDTYGIPGDSVTPSKVTDIEFNGSVDPLANIPTTGWTTSDGTSKGIPGTWTFDNNSWSSTDSYSDKITKVTGIKDDENVYGKWTFTPDTYTLTYHVAGDATYGVPGDSVTPDQKTGIEYNGSVNPLENVPSTSWTTSDGTANGIPGTWTFENNAWSSSTSYSDKLTKVTGITENKDVYGKWTFTPDTYTLTYHVAGDATYGVPGDSVTPDQNTGIAYDGSVNPLEGIPTTSWTTSDGTTNGIPGSWTFDNSAWSSSTSYSDKLTMVTGIREDKDVYGKWTFTPGTYTLTYHVAGDATYGVPSDSVTPDQKTGIEYNGSVDPLENIPTTSWTTSDGTANGIPGTWTFDNSAWSSSTSYSDKLTKVTGIKEDKDVYGKWTFTPDTYTLTYHVAGDATYGVPSDSVTPDQKTGIEYNGSVDPLENIPTTSWTTSDGTANGIPGTWTFDNSAWSSSTSYSDKLTKVTGIKEDEDVYGKWTFTPDTYTLTYHVSGDAIYGIPGGSVTPSKVEDIEYNGSVDPLADIPSTNWNTSDGTTTGVPGTWTFDNNSWSSTIFCSDTITAVRGITEDQDVFGKWTFTPDTYTLTYHVAGDAIYGVPGDSVTPDTKTGIPYNGSVNPLENVPTTQWTTSDGTSNGIKGTWTFENNSWSSTDSYSDTINKVTGIKSDEHVYGKWVFVAATPEPTAEPTPVPTAEPTPVPTEEPTPVPTEEPTPVPTEEPTPVPTEEPTPVPTEEPTPVPTEEPTPVPTEEPTPVPTDIPTPEPTAEPTAEPTQEPEDDNPVTGDFGAYGAVICLLLLMAAAVVAFKKTFNK